MDKLKELMKSRKFWAAVVGVLVIVVKEFDPDFPLDTAQLSNLVYVLVAYILGTALEDGMARSAPAAGEGK